MQISLSAASGATSSRARFGILAMLFVVTVLNYADRATVGVAGPVLSKELGISSVQMGYIFSAFSWAYVAGQLPGGWLLDRFGAKKVYAWSILLWSVFTMLQGAVHFFDAATAIVVLFALRFMVGLAESPSFPANGRMVAAWFPVAERGTASAIFNSAQYFATVLFAPIMAWIVSSLGWQDVFYFMGALGVVLSLVWLKTMHNSPLEHPGVSAAERQHIEAGGALLSAQEAKAGGARAPAGPKLAYLKQLLGNRMLLGVYIAQYCVNTLTYFFLTWFPVYLVKERGMTVLNAGIVAAVPAICGFAGGVLGGVVSDWLLRRGHSLTVARKVPIVIGMLLSTSMIACNYVELHWLVVAIMALAFFGKGLGALGWAVVSDTSPKEIAGLSGAMFNTFGNIAGITTPIVIGYIVQETHSFNGALVFVGAHAVIAVVSYLLVVGEIKRVQLKA
ncbi:MFS transporter [Roseateles terrae]|uniref:ACS family glucarate transporter-like MFS transporter n=1 Tax=Roseateles terrae TaxID=431060 RepID=A0ABR6GT68_9BURK|nr:MFS transporter [Roseateles terrae]MBB3195293.1 ACS family glucarate transporter-like MFS transporter [Roseateles terrae]OWQ87294.1 MFS transporter [Roseateles terrae]